MQEPESDVLRSYNGYLSTGHLSPEVIERIFDLCKIRGIQVDVTPCSIDFDFTGRDTNRFVVELLIQIADLIRDAEGEVRCEISGDTTELSFEFYRICDGKLLRQIARIVRDPESVVVSARE